METKTFEIRDRMTFIPALAIRLSTDNERDRYLISRAGYGRRNETQSTYVLLGMIAGGEALKFHCDPFLWGANPRTMGVVHEYIVQKWDSLISGAVIDVEFIAGETAEPKRSEAEEFPETR